MKRTSARTSSSRVVRLVSLIGVLVGISFIISPLILAWSNARTQDQQVQHYASTVEKKDFSAQLEEARRYNEKLDGLSVGDPYQGDNPQNQDDYWHALNVDGTDVMGTIFIPGGTSLPIYHGTSNETLDRGVGHLYGSSLPIGGLGTHAVLSGHSGVPNNKLFDPLHKVQLGQRFIVQVLGQDLVYKVTNIQVLTPQDAEHALKIDKDKDQVTLVTCYPYGINSHRLLVTGQRTDDVANVADAVPVKSPTALLWPWLIPVVAVVLLIGLWMVWPKRRGRRNGRGRGNGGGQANPQASA